MVSEMNQIQKDKSLMCTLDFQNLITTVHHSILPKDKEHRDQKRIERSDPWINNKVEMRNKY